MPQGNTNPTPTRTVLTIGTFDGVHLGHLALVRAARSKADGLARATNESICVVVLAFDPHPVSTLSPGNEPARLTTFDRRTALLREAGADDVVQLTPTPDTLALTHTDFVDRVLLPYNPLCIVEGSDFHFGKGRAGNVDILKQLGAQQPEHARFDVHVVAPVPAVLSDHTIVRASSTMTRWLLSHGRVEDAARVLGRWYEVGGIVEQGDQRGRTIGYPTANIRTECMVPADGVYAAIAQIPHMGQTHLNDAHPRFVAAAVSIGHKPTFECCSFAVEAHILDDRNTSGASAMVSTLPHYGWEMRLRFVAWIREQIRYDALEPLLAQMQRDCANIQQTLDVHAVPSPTEHPPKCIAQTTGLS